MGTQGQETKYLAHRNPEIELSLSNWGHPVDLLKPHVAETTGFLYSSTFFLANGTEFAQKPGSNGSSPRNISWQV
jgi:hypothetical protein